MDESLASTIYTAVSFQLFVTNTVQNRQRTTVTIWDFPAINNSAHYALFTTKFSQRLIYTPATMHYNNMLHYVLYKKLGSIEGLVAHLTAPHIHMIRASMG